LATAIEYSAELVHQDFEAVNKLIVSKLESDVVLINQISHHIINSGGKRLRPLLVLLAAKACGYTGHGHISAAAIIEFIHTATLLHDDVVDESEKGAENRLQITCLEMPPVFWSGIFCILAVFK